MEDCKKMNSLFVARDQDGTLNLFETKPKRINADIGGGKTKPIWSNDDCENMELPYWKFPDLKWEDEPIEVFLNTGYDMANQINHVWAMLKCTQDELDKAHQTVQYYRDKFNIIRDAIDK